ELRGLSARRPPRQNVRGRATDLGWPNLRQLNRGDERRSRIGSHRNAWRRTGSQRSGGTGSPVTTSMPPKSDAELIEHVHNTSRFFVENRQIGWASLLAVLAWGVYGYISMPQRKDPDIPVRVAVASCQWPGADAQQVEQLITRPIEQAIGQNKSIHAPGPD